MNSRLEHSIREHSVIIQDGFIQLKGELAIPEQAEGIIVLAHGSGSDRHHRFNEPIAHALRQTALATFSINLLTPTEEDIDMRTQHYRFDIGLLALRLSKVTEWLLQNPETCHLKIGYFAANTESAVALVAASDHPEAVQAIVSRSGRTDLAGTALSRIKTPTLLIVGSSDFPGVGMNQDALAQLQVAKQLAIVPGATHLFEEQGALAEAIEFACRWFASHLTSSCEPTQSSN
jgi:pimeloyl-ACP methyl ester carboxylesterase